MTSLRIAVFQHHPAEGPGRLAHWAAARGHVLTTYLHEIPRTFDECDAIVLLGGPQSVNDVPPWLRDEMRVVERCLALGTPALGICLGAQILAKALGAEVRSMHTPEVGWTNVRFADSSALDVLQWHDDECSLPPQAVCFASSELCSVQAWRAPNRCIGLQFHPEWDEKCVDELNGVYGHESPMAREHDALRHRRVQEWFFGMLDAWLGGAGKENGHG